MKNIVKNITAILIFSPTVTLFSQSKTVLICSENVSIHSHLTQLELKEISIMPRIKNAPSEMILFGHSIDTKSFIERLREHGALACGGMTNDLNVVVCWKAKIETLERPVEIFCESPSGGNGISIVGTNDSEQ